MTRQGWLHLGIFVAGLASVAYGAWGMYKPAAFVVVGLILMGIVALPTRGRTGGRNEHSKRDNAAG